jgi:phytoene/squalene synthetase
LINAIKNATNRNGRKYNMSKNQAHQINQAYQYRVNLVRSHYENYPVASLAIPKHLRLPISAIYAFARRADDSADESNLAPEERLNNLNDYDEKLRHLDHPSAHDPIFMALAHTIRTQ